MTVFFLRAQDSHIWLGQPRLSEATSLDDLTVDKALPRKNGHALEIRARDQSNYGMTRFMMSCGLALIYRHSPHDTRCPFSRSPHCSRGGCPVGAGVSLGGSNVFITELKGPSRGILPGALLRQGGLRLLCCRPDLRPTTLRGCDDPLYTSFTDPPFTLWRFSRSGLLWFPGFSPDLRPSCLLC